MSLVTQFIIYYVIELTACSSLTILCISPIIIDNPNYGLSSKGLNFLKNCSTSKIAIPCGHCDECIAVKQMYLVQRVQMESLSNHIFFCTLTYNNDMIPYVDTSLGYRIRYASYRDLSCMFKRLRLKNSFGRSFRYVAVSERGSEKARPHFHVLFLIPKFDGDDFNDVMNLESIMFKSVLFEWCRNVGSDKKPVYVPLCTYIRKFVRGKLKSTFDLHYVNPRLGDTSCSSVAFYVFKYMLKDSAHDVKLQQALKLNYSDDEYRDTWKLVKSRLLCSKGFGLNADYVPRVGLRSPDSKILEVLRDGVSSSKSTEYPYPLFYSQEDGKTFPLSPYYRKRGDIYSLDDALVFYEKSDPNYFADDCASEVAELPTRIARYKSRTLKVHALADELCDADSFDELFD